MKPASRRNPEPVPGQILDVNIGFSGDTSSKDPFNNIADYEHQYSPRIEHATLGR
jgi:hypothetical protein